MSSLQILFNVNERGDRYSAHVVYPAPGAYGVALPEGLRTHSFTRTVSGVPLDAGRV